MSPEEIRDKNLFPKGFYPLPHPNHPEGGMVFPHYEIEEIKKLDGRDISASISILIFPTTLCPPFRRRFISPH